MRRQLFAQFALRNWLPSALFRHLDCPFHRCPLPFQNGSASTTASRPIRSSVASMRCRSPEWRSGQERDDSGQSHKLTVVNWFVETQGTVKGPHIRDVYDLEINHKKNRRSRQFSGE